MRTAACLPVLILLLAAAPAADGELPVLEEIGLLTPPDGAIGDRFGIRVARALDIAVVGSWGDDTACPGDINCNSGSAYVFQRMPAGPPQWVLAKKLTASDEMRNAYFGYTVSTDGETAVVGAYYAESGVGAVYVFERDLGGPDAWGERAKLVPPDPSSPLFFGTAVALLDDTIVATAPADSYPCPATPNICLAGSVYIYQRNRGGMNHWGFVKKLIPPDGAAQQLFGQGLAGDGETIIVGAPGVNAGYVFERHRGGQNAWGFAARLKPSGFTASNGLFGRWPDMVAIVGDSIAAGGITDSRGCTPPVYFCGAVYLFDRTSPHTWEETQILTPPVPKHNAHFGASVGLLGRDLLLASETGYRPGFVYVYRRTGAQTDPWVLVGELAASDVPPGHSWIFGSSLQVRDDGMAIVGATLADHACPGDPFCDSGAAYLYDLTPFVSTCVEGESVLCLGGGRFKVEVWWRRPNGETGVGHVGGHITDNGGHFWFFKEENPELFVKVVNACTFNGHHWVFAAGLTNVEVDILVTDTATGETAMYHNPQGTRFEAVQDVGAFETCP